jgi:hypothetical protein
MGMKIKWNDDRVRGTTTAVLLISRDRLSRGVADDLIRAALADYRHDPAAYKAAKATWAKVGEVGPLTNPGHIAYYRSLLSTVEAMVKKMVQAKRQFNSLAELDNFLIFTLNRVP